jgi:hypothetical protein
VLAAHKLATGNAGMSKQKNCDADNVSQAQCQACRFSCELKTGSYNRGPACYLITRERLAEGRLVLSKASGLARLLAILATGIRLTSGIQAREHRDGWREDQQAAKQEAT